MGADTKEMQFVYDFINHLSDAVILADSDNKITAVNEKFKLLYGFEHVQAGRSVTDLLMLHHERNEGTLITNNGVMPVEIKRGALPVYEEMYHYFVFQQQPAIIPSTQEPLLKTIMNLVPDFIGIKDGDGRFVFANDFVGELFDLKGYSFTGKTDADLAVIRPFYREVFEYCIETDEQVWQTKEIVRCDEYVPAKDGGLRFFDVYKIPVFNPDGTRKNLLVFGREVTEKIESRVLLEESEARYRLLAEHSMDMITTHKPDGTYTYVSPACIALLGRDPEEMIGKTGYGILHPDDKEASLKGHEQLMSGPSSCIVQFRLKHKEGHYVWLETSCNSITDEEGQVTEIIGVTRDITERKKSEEILRQSDKLSIVGQLAASVAHEIRNPLTSLKGFIQFIQENEHLDASQFYKIMDKELNRIDQIMSQLLLLAKPQAKLFKETSINDLLLFVETLLQPEAVVQNIKIETDLSEELPLIKVEENELKQVLINLVKNAMDAMEDGGTIHIKGEVQDNKIQLSIKDEGCGIPAECLKRIGEPFYTTKEKGTGLGLMVSTKIMKEHRGNLEFDSVEGEGTTVRMILPLT
ncbi:PAS domain S-box protein [Fictibacillus barbaricus]|uniref:histidine kinase n=1 Tax=Fictibacillus barbaricus TaxID=182136 RepID=A0ABU1U338_9BACL|nr:PAS domain S-box protein [Fictibacillus barbaricus]MDR7073894.1 PAS domain S-box-containing protein [Fictibacillus barbaricus]